MDAVLRPGPGPRPSERVTTLAAVLGRAPGMDEVKVRMQDALSDALGARMEKGPLTDGEKSYVERLVKERYSRDEWNMRR
mgnify:CR=1 FL=1